MADFAARPTTFISFLLSSWAVYAARLEAAADLCQSFSTKFMDTLFLPQNSVYTELRDENWSQTAWETPTCIFQPKTTEDLQAAVSLIVEGNVSFAIRSGGHSPSPLAANIAQGVLIDMSAFNGVDYHANDQVAVVGSGQRWENVYTKLDQYGVTVVGGRVLTVGVGGLTLGSGLSYLSDLYGLVCDNVVNFEVVLANGSLVNANAESNSDLMWALKGGANNFGIVTRFTMSTYPIHDVWGGVKSYKLEDLPAIFAAVFEYQSNSNKDPYANLFILSFPTNSSFGININMVYLKPEESPAAFDPFYSIPTTADTTKLRTFADFLGGQALFGITRADWRTTSFEPDETLYKEVLNILTTSPYIDTIQSVTSGSLAFGFQPISASVIKAGEQRGGNALGLNAVNQTWFALDTLWWSSDDDKLVHDAAENMVSDIEKASKSLDKYLRYQFMNDASWDQPVIAHYGKNNERRLKQIQARYDPDLVFQQLVPGGFKVPQ
ncbi:putative FAD-binding oxidoreductase [Xylariaceae sp. AK1471]|nr:putative FAD-binding oxidoreductase [Xylariaceae sp. AK1471]